MQKQTTINPYFRYKCKSETNSTVVDSQYTFEGNYLAVSTSNASIFIYKSPIDQSMLDQSENFPIVQFNHADKNNCFLKMAWSFFNSSVLSAVSINKQICYFLFDKNALKLQKVIKSDSIPLFCNFLPSFDDCILTVAFSDGSISLFNEQLEKTFTVKAHNQSVNWLSWQRRLGLSQRNVWISEHFPSYLNQSLIKKPPLLASCSSDQLIKFWLIRQGKLEKIHEFKGHSKEIRQVMWRPNYFNTSKYRHIASCSQDGYVKFWQVQQVNKKIKQKMKSQRNFEGPVYRAQYNSLGTLIAISFYNKEEGRVQTKVFSDKDSILGDQVNITK